MNQEKTKVWAHRGASGYARADDKRWRTRRYP